MIEQLAGRYARLEAHWLTQAATGFLVGGTHDIVGNQTIEGMLQQRVDDLDDIITATGTAFLGLTISCGKCHDHKFDPITQKDYYGLQAVFAGVSHGEREIDAIADSATADAKRPGPSPPSWPAVELRLDAIEPPAHPDADAAERPMVNSASERRAVRADQGPDDPDDDPGDQQPDRAVHRRVRGLQLRRPARENAGAGLGAAARRRPRRSTPARRSTRSSTSTTASSATADSWISRVPGKGTLTIHWPEAATIDRIVWGRDREGQFLRPAGDRSTTSRRPWSRDEWQVIASSVDRVPYRAGAQEGTGEPAGLTSERTAQRKELRQRRTQLRQAAGTAWRDGLGLRRQLQPAGGDALCCAAATRCSPGRRSSPSGIASVPPRLVIPQDAPEARPSRRLGEMDWRSVQPAAGKGHGQSRLVPSFRPGHRRRRPATSAITARRPSHPELLDWLASRYIAGGWRLKPLHRLIVLSSTYRQSSLVDAKAQSLDRQNQLLWHIPLRRLEAESIRDAILRRSGRLDRTMGGPGYNIWEKNTNYVAVYRPRGELGPDTFRRMVYQFKPRSQQDPTFGAFDCPDAALVAPRRYSSTTALQALNLLNSAFVHPSGFPLRRAAAARGWRRADASGRPRLHAGLQPISFAL